MNSEREASFGRGRGVDDAVAPTRRRAMSGRAVVSRRMTTRPWSARELVRVFERENKDAPTNPRERDETRSMRRLNRKEDADFFLSFGRVVQRTVFRYARSPPQLDPKRSNRRRRIAAASLVSPSPSPSRSVAGRISPP
eukprot:29312-Pelagococcus_subviridis.AAC.10